MEEFVVYIIYSETLDQYYVGQTGNLEERIARHNQGDSKSTKGGIPWELKYVESFPDRTAAMKRERQIKKWKSRVMIERLIKE